MSTPKKTDALFSRFKNVSDLTAHMESFDFIPGTCEYILSEIVTYVLIAGEDTLVISDDNNNNSNSKNTVNINKKILENFKAEDGSCRTNFNTKAKRGRPCAKPPTKEILRKRGR